jgi:uncharacterized repeat protein (TIGR01451 family)
MSDSLAVRHVQRFLLISLLAGLTLFVLLVLFATRPVLAAPEQVVCYATPDGGVTVFESEDTAEALRDAIAAADSGDTIWVAGTCQGTSHEGGTDQVARIAESLTIMGYLYDGDVWTYDATAPATIDAQQTGRVFSVHTPGPAVFANLYLINGLTTGSGGAVYTTGDAEIADSILEDNRSGNLGGAILSYGSLDIRDTQLISNTTLNHGGAIAVRGSGADELVLERVTFTANYCSNASGCFGGAISALNSVSMTDTVFADNYTTGSGFSSGGGAIYSVSDLTIDNSTFVENRTGATGGALYAHAPLTIRDSAFTGNEAELGGGAIWTSSTGEISGSHLEGNRARVTSSRGGAVLNTGALAISATDVYSNSAYHGGGIFNTTSSSLNLSDAEVSWNTADLGFGSGGGVRNEGDLTVAGTLFNNNRSYSGGGLATNDRLELQQTAFTNNVARSGGAISQSGGTGTIDEASFTANRATGTPNEWEQPGGGAIALSLGHMTVTGSTFASNEAVHRGGAIYNSASFATTLSILESEFTGNAADFGGGLYLREDTTIATSRIFENQAAGGGAIAITGQADVVLTNNFIAGNEASGSGDTLYFDNTGQRAGTLNATHNTFVGTGAGTAVETNGVLVGYDIELTNVIVSGYETAIRTFGVTDTVTIDGVLWHDVTTNTAGLGITVANEWEGNPAFLDPANHDYHLLPSSAALDRGVATAVAVDIDGEARPQGDGPDLGADELAVLLPDLVIHKSVAPAEPTPGALVTYNLTFRNAGVGVMEDVVVSDVLPDTLEIVEVTATGVDITDGTATTWAVGDLAAGEGGTITVVARVLPDVSIGTEIVNGAEISGTGEEATLVNNTASATVTVGNFKLYLSLIVKALPVE